MRHPKRTQLRCPGENGRSDSAPYGPRMKFKGGIFDKSERLSETCKKFWWKNLMTFSSPNLYL